MFTSYPFLIMSIWQNVLEVYKSVGEGDEFRFGNKQVNGFALVNNEEVVHMAAFAE